MKNEIENAIKLLANGVGTNAKSEDTMRNSQAALNWAHVLQVLAQTATINPGK